MLSEIHDVFGWVVVIANAIAGLWALGAYQWKALRRRELWWFTAFAEITIVVQVIIGVVMVSAQGYEAPEFHMFYGFVALATVGIVYSYRAQLKQYQYLLYGFGGLFLMGLGLRAMIVDNAPIGG